MLQVTNLVVDHGKLRALWDVSLCVHKGERVGLLGANGAGKSTTLGAVIGLYRATAGSIRFNDAAIAGRSVAANVAAGIALVPEGRRLFPEMSVSENLQMGAFPSSARPRLTAQLDCVYALFPILAERRVQPAGTLSGGQQQMVAIGRALMASPSLMLLDEPFLGVAPVVVEQVMLVLRQISELGVTMVLVEQNIHRALEFVQRAYVIENGRTILEGDKASLTGDPQFTSKFLGLE
jgi:branched-chain amino acid transport system ATP-binding protein